MFGKLLKYELKSQQKLLTILSFAALGAGLLGGLALWLLVDVLQQTEGTATVIGTVLSVIFLFGVLLGIVAYVVAVFILLLYRFYKHHFSEQGYLTFTLPVTAHQTLLASIVNIVIWELVAMFVCICSLCLMFAPSLAFAWKEVIQELKPIWQDILAEMNEATGGFFTISFLLNIISWIYSLIIPLTCITIGCLLTKKYRVLTAFAIYYGLQLGMSLISGVLSVIVSVTGFVSDSGNNGLYWFSIIIPYVLQLGLAIGGYFLMHRMVSKKLNLP